MKVIFIILLIFIIGCGASAPKRSDFKSDVCYQEAYCRYTKSHSKTAIDCSAVATRCDNVEKEKRMLERYEYCKNPANRWKNKDAQSCWDKLNSK